MVPIKRKRYDRNVSVSPSLKVLSENLRKIRAARGMTQERLAELADISVRHYQQIEGQHRPGLQVATVDRLAKALKTTAAVLFSRRLGINARADR